MRKRNAVKNWTAFGAVASLQLPPMEKYLDAVAEEEPELRPSFLNELSREALETEARTIGTYHTYLQHIRRDDGSGGPGFARCDVVKGFGFKGLREFYKSVKRGN